MAKNTTPPLQWLSNQIEQLDTDLLRQMLKVITEYLMGLGADLLCGAEFGQKVRAVSTTETVIVRVDGLPE